MAKPEQVLQISPQNELRFKGPFNVPVTAFMTLTNPSDKKVLFKIKTTAPRKYCVRPNSGILEPHSTTDIMICLQPFIFDPAEKNKHKFMVQTVFAPDGDINLEQLWKDISPEQLMDSKLKCVFEPPPDMNETKEEPAAAKASPKAPAQAAVNSAVEPEQRKTTVEGDHADEDVILLRRENLKLKEEILRLKHSGGLQQPQQHQPLIYQPPEPVQADSFYYIAIAVLLAALGVVVGKFVL